MIILAIYILGIFGFCLWDSWIGMPVIWNDGSFATRNKTPLSVAALVWPFATPIVILVKFNKYLDEAKERRLQREAHKQKVRIAAQKELESLVEQVDIEMEKISSDKRV
jgi:hypothetical protein